MLPTLGLIYELNYIVRTFGCAHYFTLAKSENQEKAISINIAPGGYMDVWYVEQHIWGENTLSEDNFFGIESIDNISRIIACIDNNDSLWKEKYYYNELEKSLT